MALNIEQTELPSATAISSAWLKDSSSALYASDPDAFARMFVPEGWFRDSLTFTWNNRALNGRAKIASYLNDGLPFTQISNIRVSDDPHLAPTYRVGPHEIVEFGFTYETTLAMGTGFVRLVRADFGQWLALTASMIVSNLKGWEECPVGHDWEAQGNDRTWGEILAEAQTQAETNPRVLIGTWSV